MSAPELQHRLAAILSAEGEGYTRLLAEDEPLAEVLRIRPDFSIAKIPRVSRREFLVENLRNAGLKE